MIFSPLYGHNSEETAFRVDSYPYGREKCIILFWLESSKKGFRLVSRTQNPKTMRWNAEKKSTYMLLAGCMYLDDQSHVHWSGLSEYSGAKEVLEFIESFPQADLSRLVVWVLGKKAICNTKLAGRAIISIGGVPQLPTESEKEDAAKDLAIYEKCQELLTNLRAKKN